MSEHYEDDSLITAKQCLQVVLDDVRAYGISLTPSGREMAKRWLGYVLAIQHQANELETYLQQLTTERN